jgi:hypothetical protein
MIFSVNSDQCPTACVIEIQCVFCAVRIEFWHWDSYISQYFGYPLSASCHRCSTLSFIYMLPSLEEQAGVAWEPSSKAMLFRKSENIGWKVVPLTSDFKSVKCVWISERIRCEQM